MYFPTMRSYSAFGQWFYTMPDPACLHQSSQKLFCELSLHHQIVSKPVKSFARIILKSISISLGEHRLHDFQSLGSHLLGFHLHRESSRTVHRETSFHSLSELCYLGLGSLVFPSPYIYIIHRTRGESVVLLVLLCFRGCRSSL